MAKVQKIDKHTHTFLPARTTSSRGTSIIAFRYRTITTDNQDPQRTGNPGNLLLLVLGPHAVTARGSWGTVADRLGSFETNY